MARSNVNLSFGEFYREHRYLNCAKSAQRVNDSVNLDYYLTLTANQYPTASTPAALSFVVYVPGPGPCVVKWKGSGSFTSVSFGTLTNASRTYGGFTWGGGGAGGATVTNGRMTFVAPSTGQSSVSITGSSMTEFVVCRQDEEDLLDAGGIIRPAFAALLTDANVGYIRFMDAQQVNLSVLNKWAERPSPDFITHHSSCFFPNNVVGDNGSGRGFITGTNTLAAASYTGMPGTYQHGETIHGRMVNDSSSTTVTLNVGGRGAKTVWFDYGQAPIATGTNPNVRLLTTAGVYTWVFDAFYDFWFVNRIGPAMGHPIEYLVEMCNVTGIPGWFCIPVMASDSFITSWAQYFVDHYTPATILFEYGNEVWNTGGGFIMTNRVAKWGDVTFPGITASSGANYSGYYGYRMAQAAAIIRGVFSAAGQGSKVKVVLACQGATGNTVEQITDIVENKRFQNTSYPALSGANAPILSADYVSYATYYGGKTIHAYDSEYTTDAAFVPDLVTAADDYASGDATRMREALEWLRTDMTDNYTFFQTHALGATGRFENFNTLALEYGKEVVHYEQNHQIDPPSVSWATGSPINDASYGGPTGKINVLILAFLASEQYFNVVQQWLTAFYSRSQSHSSSIFGMCTVNPWLTFPRLTPTGEIGLAGDTTQPPYANWRAHALRNNNLRRFRVAT